MHRAGTHTAGNEGQIFQPWPALFQCPAHDLVPVFTGSGLHNPVFVGLIHQFAAHDLNLECQGFHVAGQHNIAAATQDKRGMGGEIVAGYGLAQILYAGDAQ